MHLLPMSSDEWGGRGQREGTHTNTYNPPPTNTEGKGCGRLGRLASTPLELRSLQRQFRSKDTPWAHTLVHRPCPAASLHPCLFLSPLTLPPTTAEGGTEMGLQVFSKSSKRRISDKPCGGFLVRTIRKQNASSSAAAETAASLFPLSLGPRAHTWNGDAAMQQVQNKTLGTDNTYKSS